MCHFGNNNYRKILVVEGNLMNDKEYEIGSYRRMFFEEKNSSPVRE